MGILQSNGSILNRFWDRHTGSVILGGMCGRADDRASGRAVAEDFEGKAGFVR